MTRRAPRKGPGITKARAARLVATRTVEVWRSADYRWTELFATADVVSEGAVRTDSEGATYYGTTSLVIPLASRGGVVPDDHAAAVARLVDRDLHARLRAVRIACREAQVRSVQTIGRIRAELSVRRDAHGIRIDVDVEARTVAGATHRRARGGR